MRIKNGKMITRSALALAVSASLGTGVALAQQNQQGSQKVFTGTLNQTQARQLFQHMDQNGDGQLSFQETGPFIEQSRFNKADENNNDSLSPEEFVAAALNDKEMVVQIFARAQAQVEKQRQAQASAQASTQTEQQAKVTVTETETETTVSEEDAMKIGVREAAPEIEVEQAQPQVMVREQQPEITVEQPKPEVVVKQPAPQVTVNQPEPQVVIEEAQPDVDVDTAEPEVTVRETGRPEVDVETGEAEVTVEQVGQAAAQQQQARATVEEEEEMAVVMVEETEATVTTETETAMSGLYALTIVDLVEREVINANGQEIGEIEELVLNVAGNEIFAIVSVGGWLGIGDHDIAISLDELEMAGDQVMMTTEMTEEQLEERPAYNPSQYRILEENNRPLSDLVALR